MALSDPHSYADDAQPTTTELELDLRIDFNKQMVNGSVTLHLDRKAEGRLDLDTRDLVIETVTDGKGSPLTFDLAPPDLIKGSRLRIPLDDDSVCILFHTSKNATALQWLEPAQTAGGKQPYVFTQCQPTHARSIFPCQDTPRARVRYHAMLEIPGALKAVMAARHVDRAEAPEGRAVERFEMPQPIPPYLFAFAVGDLTSSELGPRSRVWAEPPMVAAGAWEFAGVDEMIIKAESLFGPYDWERFDILLMPPSFPYGGMENPRLTFLTPTLIAGDRSLVSVVAHELAHSWTGNLVTNVTMNEFWLNEGFTTYAERRIIETLGGRAELELHAALGRKGLDNDIARFGAGSPITQLRTDLTGVDPDSVYSRVPYEKGYLFLRRIEEVVGREAFDRFLKAYIGRFRFRSITTEDFLSCIRSELPGIDDKVDLKTWLDAPGLPADAPKPVSDTLVAIDELSSDFAATGRLPSAEDISRWTPLEWQIYLAALPRKITFEQCAEFDRRFKLTASKNAEIKVAWLGICAASDYVPAFPAIRETLRTVGRMKYLRPLYLALISGGDRTRRFAAEVYHEAEAGYHPVARAMVEGLLAAPVPPAG